MANDKVTEADLAGVNRGEGYEVVAPWGVKKATYNGRVVLLAVSKEEMEATLKMAGIDPEDSCGGYSSLTGCEETPGCQQRGGYCVPYTYDKLILCRCTK